MDASDDGSRLLGDEALFLHPADSGSSRMPVCATKEASVSPSAPGDRAGSDNDGRQEATSLNTHSPERRDDSNLFDGFNPPVSGLSGSCAVFAVPGDTLEKASSSSEQSQSGQQQSLSHYPGPGFLSCSISSESLASQFRSEKLELQKGSDESGHRSASQDRIASGEADSTVVSVDTGAAGLPRLFGVPVGGRVTAEGPHSRPRSPCPVTAAPEESVLSLCRTEAGGGSPHQPSFSRLPPKQPTALAGSARCARASRGTSWIPLDKDLDTATGRKEKTLSCKLEQLIWQVRLLRELLAGLIGMQAVFVLTNFVLDNASAGIVSLFCLFCCILAHADRRPATYLLTALLALAFGATVVASLCTRVYGFEPYYLDDIVHRVSTGQALVLLLVFLATAVLCLRTVQLQKEHRKTAGYTLKGSAQPGSPLSNLLLQRGTSTAQYLLRPAESVVAGGSTDRSATVRIPPPLAEEDDEMEGSTSTAPAREV